MMKRSGGAAVGLQGPRPQPLSLPAAASSSARPSKRPRGDDAGAGGGPGPVIVYERTPRVIHARPDEFKALVQRLTGQHQQRATGADQEPAPLLPAAEPAPPSSSQEEEEETRTAAGDPLVLTLGQQAAPPLDDRASAGLLSPGAAGFLLSPGSLLFSPATMQAIQELISS